MRYSDGRFFLCSISSCRNSFFVIMENPPIIDSFEYVSIWCGNEEHLEILYEKRCMPIAYTIKDNFFNNSLAIAYKCWENGNPNISIHCHSTI